MGINKRFRVEAGNQERIEKAVKVILTENSSPPAFNHFYMNFGKKLARLKKKHGADTFVNEACIEAAKWLNRGLDGFILREILNLFMAKICAPHDAHYVLTLPNADLPNAVLGDGRYLLLDGSNANVNIDIGAFDLKATSFSIGANTLTTTEFGYLDGQNQSVTTNSAPIFNGITLTHTLDMGGGGNEHSIINADNITCVGDGTFDEVIITNPIYEYKLTGRGGALCLVNTSAGGIGYFELFTNDGDGTDAIHFDIFGKGTTGSITNSETLYLWWAASVNEYRMFTYNSGTGTLRPISIFTGLNNSQLYLNTNGSILMLPTYSVAVGGVNRDLYIDNTGLIGYNPSAAITKTNIRPLDSSLIYHLNPIKFDRADGSAIDEAGLIAEEVNAVMPQLISCKQVPIIKQHIIDGMPLEYTEWMQTDEPETVNYSRLICYLLKEIHNLNNRIEVLERGR